MSIVCCLVWNDNSMVNIHVNISIIISLQVADASHAIFGAVIEYSHHN